MRIWHYDPETHALRGEGQADPDPRTGGALVPAHATPVAPPSAAAGEVPVYDRAAMAWTVVEDHRGKSAWSTVTGQPIVMSAPGPVAAGVTLTAPGPHDRWDDATGQWTEDPARAAAGKAKALTAVDRAIGELRAALVTAVAGQSEAYDAKAAELAAWEAAGEPVDPPAVGYPWAADRAAMLTGLGTAKTIADVMREWRARRGAWTELLRATERAREAAKHRIRGSSSAGAADAVTAALAGVCATLRTDLAAVSAAGGVPDVPVVIAALDDTYLLQAPQ